MHLIDIDELLKDKGSYDPVKYTHEYGFVVSVDDILKSPTVEPLTDMEERIFLAAMGREEQVCKKIDDAFPEEESLIMVCKEIERKVKKALWTN